MFNKKAQGISINVIIVAVIALLVLVVLMAIFGGQMGLWGQNLDETQSRTCTGESGIQGAKIISDQQDCGEDFSTSFYKFTDVDPGYKCCIPTEVQ